MQERITDPPDRKNKQQNGTERVNHFMV